MYIPIEGAIGITVGITGGILLVGMFFLGAIGLCQEDKELTGHLDPDHVTLTGFLGLCALGLASLYPLTWNQYNVSKKEYKESYHVLQKNISSLERDADTSGRFFLGCGYIDANPIYYFYEEVSADTYVLGSLKQEGHTIYIVETNEYSPSIYKAKKENTNPDNYYYNIYVPKNTVRKTFTV